MKYSLVGAKLPSVSDILRLYLQKLTSSVKTKNETASQTMQEVEQFWHKARIPISPRHHSIEQLEQLIFRWERRNKNKTHKVKYRYQKRKA